MKNKSALYDEYIKRLVLANDETRTIAEHLKLTHELHGYIDALDDAKGIRFNGDYYYIDLIDKGEMKERPMCCGYFLDWGIDGYGGKDES